MENIINPIHQFNIVRLINISFFGLDFSFTNVSLFISLGTIFSFLFFLIASSNPKIIPNRLQSIAEISYEFISSILRKSSTSEIMNFFPLVFSLFIFILISNFIGLFPYFYTVTSQIIITFTLAILVNLIVVFYGFFKNGIYFLKLFSPDGVPVILLPLVFFIEVISFLSRPISLSVRLFANILAGHITLKVFSGFVTSIIAFGGYIGIFGALLPLAMTIFITALEFLVAFLQAYIFIILTCMYLNNSIHPKH